MLTRDAAECDPQKRVVLILNAPGADVSGDVALDRIEPVITQAVRIRRIEQHTRELPAAEFPCTTRRDDSGPFAAADAHAAQAVGERLHPFHNRLLTRDAGAAVSAETRALAVDPVAAVAQMRTALGVCAIISRSPTPIDSASAAIHPRQSAIAPAGGA